MRARNIKPGIFKNEVFGLADPLYMILFQGLWCIADREGRLEDRPRRIKAEIFAYRNALDVNEMLSWLEANDFITRYEFESSKYIAIKNFQKHQTPHHMEVKSVIPPPPGSKNKYNADPVAVPQRRRIYERDGYKCLHCGSTDNLSIDHIKAVENGGDSSDGNLQTLCQSCNSSKGKRDVVKIRSSRSRDDKQASHPTDSLIPDSLIPDCRGEEANEIQSALPDEIPIHAIAKGLLENLSIICTGPTLNVVAQAIQFIAKDKGVDNFDAANLLHPAAAEAKKAGQRVDRFWFEDGRYNDFMNQPRRGNCDQHPNTGLTDKGQCYGCYREQVEKQAATA